MEREKSHRPDWLGLLGLSLLFTAVGLIVAGAIALRSVSPAATSGDTDDEVTATTATPPSMALGPGGTVIDLGNEGAVSVSASASLQSPRQGATILFVAAGVAGAAGSLLVARRARAKATSAEAATGP